MTSGGITSNFLCQRCLHPLKIDSSLSEELNEHTRAELALPANEASVLTPMDEEIVDEGEVVESPRPTVRFTDESGNPTELSHRLKMAADLFDLVSENSGTDHPLCEECADSLLETMDRRLKSAEEEAQEYQAYLKKLDSEEGKDPSGRRTLEDFEEDLAEALREEAYLIAQLEELKGEERLSESKLGELLEEKKVLDDEEDRCWREYSAYKRKLLIAEDEYRSLDCQFKYAQKQLEMLKKTNVYNATFHIWHTGHFVTINGFRLGRLPSVPVEWPEINAAWGQTALLLSCLSKKIGIKQFNKYKLVPYGNYSYIKVLADDKELPLYGNGGFRMIWDTKFDSGMAAFLDCLCQFGSAIESEGAGFNLPYEMDREKGKIRDSSSGQYYSIKLQFNSEDSWTKALRYMLTNLKWALAFVSARYMKSESDLASIS